jgi:hypothetical protein
MKVDEVLNFNRYRMDYIFVSSGIAPSIQRSGCLPFYSLLHSDHRPYYVDFSPRLLFRDHTNEIHKPAHRLLCLRDPRVTARYKTELHKFVEHHKILEKCTELHQASTVSSWDNHKEELYYKLDAKITDGMLHSERKLGRMFTGQFSWSPILKTAVQAYRCY